MERLWPLYLSSLIDLYFHTRRQIEEDNFKSLGKKAVYNYTLVAGFFFPENEKCCQKNWLCLTHAAFLVAVGKQYALALSPLLRTSCKNLFLMLQDFSKYNHFLKENQLDYTGKYLRKAEIIAPIITGEPGGKLECGANWGQIKKYFPEFREEADNTQVYKAAVVYLDSVFKV